VLPPDIAPLPIPPGTVLKPSTNPQIDAIRIYLVEFYRARVKL